MKIKLKKRKGLPKKSTTKSSTDGAYKRVGGAKSGMSRRKMRQAIHGKQVPLVKTV